MNYIESKIECCRSIGRDLMSESDLAWIAKHSDFSDWYAREVLKGRFELGEAAIATKALSSCLYACWVLKGRFELGEAAIATNSHYKERYNALMDNLGIDFELH